MSFCVSAQMAVNSVVIAPRQRQADRAVLFVSRRGCMRISRNTPATTIVLECSRAETGVGPSMAAGSQGCSPNWADFPVAARMRPSRGSRVILFWLENSCGISQDDRVIASQAIERINPMSPIRL